MGSRWLSRLAVATVAAGALTVSTVTAVWADATIPINPSQVPTTAAGFNGGDDCMGPLADLPAGVDGWHFVLPSGSGDSFLSLTLTFTKPGGGTEIVTITSTDPNNPSEDPDGEWAGYFDNAGNVDKHAYVFTTAGWTLTAGSATVTGTPGQNPQFVLSHTCAGTPTPPTTPPATPTTPPPTTNGGNGTTPGRPPTSNGGAADLPVTGTPVGGIFLAGVGLVVVGLALVAALAAARRRREISDGTEG